MDDLLFAIIAIPLLSFAVAGSLLGTILMCKKLFPIPKDEWN